MRKSAKVIGSLLSQVREEGVGSIDAAILVFMAFIIREAQHRDIPRITEIYNDAVMNTVAVWNDATATESDRQAWLEAHRQPGTSVLVAAEVQDVPGGEGTVLGYAAYGAFRSYDGFRDTVENSVYVASDVRAGGVGTALMTALLIRARQDGKHVMVAAIESENLASLRLHAKIGFSTVGQLPEVGVKFGRRLGMTLMQITLD